MKWEWKFDPHKVGYGINSWFLSYWPYTSGNLTVGGVYFETKPWFKRPSVLGPAQSLAIGDGMPKSDGLWSSSLWWPNACMDSRASTSKGFEGIDINRHRGTGIVAFNDGHSEARKDAQINPPIDPPTGPKGLINSKYWDPLQRGGDR